MEPDSALSLPHCAEVTLLKERQADAHTKADQDEGNLGKYAENPRGVAVPEITTPAVPRQKKEKFSAKKESKKQKLRAPIKFNDNVKAQLRNDIEMVGGF